MTVTLTIDCENAAFYPDPELEIVRILRAAADKVEAGIRPPDTLGLRDVNGNTVGTLHISRRLLHGNRRGDA